MKIVIKITADDEEFIERKDHWAILVKERAKWKCEKCGFKSNRSKESKFTKGRFNLVAHHKDKNRQNNILKNGQCLCRKCHAFMHKEIYKANMMRNKLAVKNSHKNRTKKSRTKAANIAWQTRREKYPPSGYKK